MTTATARPTTRLTGTLPAVQPFDLRMSVRFLSGFSPCKGQQVLTDDTITKAVAIDGQPLAFRLSPSPGGVAYLLHSDTAISPGTHARARQVITRYLSLSDDLSAFYAAAEGDAPGYRRIVEDLRGLHHVRFLTLAEVAVWAVLTQRTPGAVALAAKDRLVAEHGRAVDFEGVRHLTFPELADLRHLTEADFLPLVKNARKSEYLVSLVAGLLDIGEDHLRTAPYPAAERALRAIRGVGGFTAAMILLRGLGRMDEVPLEMRDFTAGATRVYGPGEHGRTLRSRYGSDLGYWAYYLKAGLGSPAR